MTYNLPHDDDSWYFDIRCCSCDQVYTIRLDGYELGINEEEDVLPMSKFYIRCPICGSPKYEIEESECYNCNGESGGEFENFDDVPENRQVSA